MRSAHCSKQRTGQRIGIVMLIVFAMLAHDALMALNAHAAAPEAAATAGAQHDHHADSADDDCGPIEGVAQPSAPVPPIHAPAVMVSIDAVAQMLAAIGWISDGEVITANGPPIRILFQVFLN